MNKPILFLKIALLAFTFASCREIVNEPFPNFDPVPCIIANLVDGDTLKVNVSMAEKFDTLPLDFVDNAEVELYINDVFAENLSYSQGGNYRSTSTVKPLHKYTCKVKVPGYNAIECSQTIPQKPKITHIEHINIAGHDEEGYSYPAVKITFENKPSDNISLYEITIWGVVGPTDTKPGPDWEFVNPKEGAYRRVFELKEIVEPVILNEGLPLPLFSNETITDTVYTVYLNYTSGHYSSINRSVMKTILYPILIELRQVTEDYFRYKKQLYLYKNGLDADGVINSMVNTNIYSNIENGYGIFAGYSSFLSDTIIPKP